MTPREGVIEDVLRRLAEEHGAGVLALDWAILEDIAEAEAVLSTKHEISMARAMERHKKLAEITSGKASLDSSEHRSLVLGAVKRRMRAEKRLVKKARRGRANDKKRGWTTVAKPPELRKRLDGVSVGQDKNGFFARTHRARCKSYPSMEAIPKSKVAFIRSTG